MRKGFGVCCIILGICCLISSVGLIVYNQWEEERAQIASQIILQDIRENIQEIIPDNITDSVAESPPEEQVTQESIPEPTDTEALPPDESERDISPEITAEIPKEMLTAQVNGYDCIGVLSIPVLELELPEDQWYYEMKTLAEMLGKGERERFFQNLELSCLVAETLERARKSAGMCF